MNSRFFTFALVFLLLLCCNAPQREIKSGKIKPYEQQYPLRKKPILPPCSCSNDSCAIHRELGNRDYSVSVAAFRKYLKFALDNSDSTILNHLAHTRYGSGERYSTIRSVPEWDLDKPGCIELSIYIGSQTDKSSSYHYEMNRRTQWLHENSTKRKANLSFYQKLYFTDTNSLEYNRIRDSLSQNPLKKVLFNQIMVDRRAYN